MRSTRTCRTLVLAGLAVLLQLVVFGASVSLAQSAQQPNAQRAVPTLPPGPNSGYVYVPPQTSAPAQALPPNYCAPPWQPDFVGGQPYCMITPPCPFEEQPAAWGQPNWANNQVACCPPGQHVTGNGTVGGAFCCPPLPSGSTSVSFVNSNGFCATRNFSGGDTVASSVMAVPVTMASCPQGSYPNYYQTQQTFTIYCMQPATCPPSYTLVNNQCVTLFGTGPAPPPATPAVPFQNLPHLPPQCMAGQVWTSIGGCCAPAKATSKGLCCSDLQVPKDDGSCGFPPAAQNANQIPAPVEQYVIPPQGPGGAPATVPNVSQVSRYQPGPTCGPPATLETLTGTNNSGWITNPFTGQPQPTSLDVCKTPAQGCPTGWHASGDTTPPSATFYCCPDGRFAHAGGQCCPPGGPPSGSAESNLGCVQPVPASCASGGVAIGDANPFCVTPARCPSGYALTGTTCCPSNQVSALGACCPPGNTCCPPGLAAQSDGTCKSTQSTLNTSPIPPPVEEYKIPPQGPVAAPVTVPNVTSVSPYPPGPLCAPSATLDTLTGAANAGSVTNPFTGQPQMTSLDVCKTPASGCPAGTQAVGNTVPPSSTFYCCPVDQDGRPHMRNGLCCLRGIEREVCSAPQQASCQGGAVAIGGLFPICVTPAVCPSGFTLTGTMCCPSNMVSSLGSCCPPGNPPRAGGGCTPPPAVQNANQTPPIPPPIEQYKIPPQGPGATPVTVPNVTSVSTYPTGPICAPPATLVTDYFPWPGQTIRPIDACQVPASGCPPGTFATGASIPPSSTYYCCPTSMRVAGHLGSSACCPWPAPGSHDLCGGPPVPATAMNCAAGSIARTVFSEPPAVVCETLALCPSGTVLTGTSCCPSNMVSSVGTCCPPGSPPRAGGDCTPPPPPPPAQTPNPPQPVPPPVVNLVACPNDLVRRDAFEGDAVCVTRATRTQIIVDNTASPSRTRPNGNCQPGFVWREAAPRDHACVPPASHTQAGVDNRQQCGGDLHCRNGVVTRPTFRSHPPRREPTPRTRTDKPRTTSGHPTSFRSATRRSDRHR